MVDAKRSRNWPYDFTLTVNAKVYSVKDRPIPAGKAEIEVGMPRERPSRIFVNVEGMTLCVEWEHGIAQYRGDPYVPTPVSD